MPIPGKDPWVSGIKDMMESENTNLKARARLEVELQVALDARNYEVAGVFMAELSALSGSSATTTAPKSITTLVL